jgi:multisubunit Na+/H+ antiporter MnhG subunit
MTAREIAAAILLALSVGAMGLSCIGLVLLRDVYDRLHCVGFATLVGTAGIAASLLTAQGLSALAIKGLLVFLLAAAIGAVLTHACGRAFRMREERGETT